MTEYEINAWIKVARETAHIGNPPCVTVFRVLGIRVHVWQVMEISG